MVVRILPEHVPMSARDWVADLFGDALADARSKLIDESWFGRRAPERNASADFGWGIERQHPEVQELWSTEGRSTEPEHAPPPQDIERGIDL